MNDGNIHTEKLSEDLWNNEAMYDTSQLTVYRFVSGNV